MVFEVIEKDLAGKIGELETRRGVIQTPALLPVVNPVKITIPPKEISEEYGFEALITNAYLIKKHFPVNVEVHHLLGFKGPIMTDSGAYQLLLYGDVEIAPEEVIWLQESMGSDIAVILDVPTGGEATRARAEETVRETLRRAEESLSLRSDPSILWVGPIQGGTYLDLLAYCARKIGSMDFHIHALGSPTQIMEQYDYPQLVDMIVTARLNLPLNRPLHLFGAGHPMILPLAVALGCDLFDSAAYAIFARDNRYMLPTRTVKIEHLHELPCSCPVCRKTTAEELKELPKEEREKLIARHNLYITAMEIRAIKQRIQEGTLWEYLEEKCRSHPLLYQAFKRLGKYTKYLEKFDPVTRGSPRGIFFFDETSLNRPEVERHLSRLEERYLPPPKEILLILPESPQKPLHQGPLYKAILASKLPKKLEKTLHVVFLSSAFGVIPEELDEVYPLSQHESCIEPTSKRSLQLMARGLLSIIKKHRYKATVLCSPRELLQLIEHSIPKPLLFIEWREAKSPNELAEEVVSALWSLVRQLEGQ
ncbi:MAG: tRNA guanosine(15) transglycosylase TgtA [Candidatus Verstraetearchaeota archaeon]|nr:tRNA guanosine(15) transglycosylase TgtA [Candidatus Verstraetearchaeota archaeon]